MSVVELEYAAALEPVELLPGYYVEAATGAGAVEATPTGAAGSCVEANK